MAVTPVRVMSTKILECSSTTGVKDSKRGYLAFGCSQKVWVTPLSLQCKAVVMPCLLPGAGRAGSPPAASKRCCCPGSGDVLVPPLSHGWVTSRGPLEVMFTWRQLVGVGMEQVFFRILPGRGVQLCSEPSLRGGRWKHFCP